MPRNAALSRLASAGILLLPFLAGSCDTSLLAGPSGCDRTTPKAKHLDADSLVLVPFSYTHHFAWNGRTDLTGYRSLNLRVSGRDSSSAVPDLDSNALGFFLDGNRVPIPPLTWQGGGGDECQTYTRPDKVDLPEYAKDTSYRVEIRKDSLPLRSWTIAFRSDSSKAPIIRIDSIAGGLSIAIQVAQNTSFDRLFFYEDGTMSWGQELAMTRSGNAISSSILMKNLWGLQQARYASEIGHGPYRICLNSNAGIEWMILDGKRSDLSTEYCQEVTTGESEAILAFLTARCRDCK